MTEKRTVLTPPERIKHVTFNIITDKSSGFIGCTATERKPSENEKNRADWRTMVVKGHSVYHVIGRGDRLHDGYIESLADAHAAGSGPFVAVDLSALDVDPTTFESFRKRKTRAEQKAARERWKETDTVDFNDPVWRKIREIAHGVKP